MPELERLDARHADAVLRFERENRAYFARSVPDRGDDYFAGFAARHAALLAEQATGRCHFHVLVGDGGAVLGRFNLVDVPGGHAGLTRPAAQPPKLSPCPSGYSTPPPSARGIDTGSRPRGSTSPNTTRVSASSCAAV